MSRVTLCAQNINAKMAFGERQKNECKNVKRKWIGCSFFCVRLIRISFVSSFYQVLAGLHLKLSSLNVSSRCFFSRSFIFCTKIEPNAIFHQSINIFRMKNQQQQQIFRVSLLYSVAFKNPKEIDCKAALHQPFVNIIKSIILASGLSKFVIGSHKIDINRYIHIYSHAGHLT